MRKKSTTAREEENFAFGRFDEQIEGMWFEFMEILVTCSRSKRGESSGRSWFLIFYRFFFLTLVAGEVGEGIKISGASRMRIT